MPHRLPAPARLACGAVKVAVISTLTALALSAGPGAVADRSGPTPVDAAQQLISLPRPVEHKLARHDCSPTGFGSDHQPVSAVVRSAQGRLRFVDFDTGWRVFTRHGAATLVGLCLAEPPTR